MKASLILENGAVFTGNAIGEIGERVFELVFNTSVVGYQEILTDPSYTGQGILMTYPLVGNYGVNSFDDESSEPGCEALVVRHLSDKGSNFRSEGNLNDYLKQHHIVGIEGVDTRAIARILREQGTMNGMITCAEIFSAQKGVENLVQNILPRIKNYRVEKAVEKVSRREVETFPAQGEENFRVAVMDYGVKRSEVDALTRRGCAVTVFPGQTAAETVLSGGFDGVYLSAGPGDPAEDERLVAAVKELLEGDLPLFGVGLGHQLMALASGAKTEKLPFGHRGSNHPVKDLAAGRCFITGQNHGYAVVAGSVDPTVAEVSHVSANDGSVEGLRYKRGSCFSVQYAPETALRRKGTEYDTFIRSMGGGKNA